MSKTRSATGGIPLAKPKLETVSVRDLGSINHTLLTIEALKQRGFSSLGIFFSGEDHPTTEGIIAKMSGVQILGRIDEEPYFDQNIIREYADQFREKLERL